MTFILAADGRREDVVAAFRQYRDYLQRWRDVFPPSAFALASSDWYFNFKDHHCPHDGWLETFSLSEFYLDKIKKERTLSLTIRLLAAYHDGYIEFHYPKVLSYTLNVPNAVQGHSDWCYDEFRLSESGRLIHEIEWRGLDATWLIEASDVEFRWIERPAAIRK
jgi:hypothetical protein